MSQNCPKCGATLKHIKGHTHQGVNCPQCEYADAHVRTDINQVIHQINQAHHREAPR